MDRAFPEWSAPPEAELPWSLLRILDEEDQDTGFHDHDESAAGVARRDRIDSTRAASPLARADDAHLLDTTGRTVQDVVEEVLSWL